MALSTGIVRAKAPQKTAWAVGWSLLPYRKVDQAVYGTTSDYTKLNAWNDSEYNSTDLISHRLDDFRASKIFETSLFHPFSAKMGEQPLRQTHQLKERLGPTTISLPGGSWLMFLMFSCRKPEREAKTIYRKPYNTILGWCNFP